MKKISFVLACLLILCTTLFANAAYLPLTDETCSQLLQDVREQFYTEDLPETKNWDTRLQGLTVTFDPNTSSRQYFADHYGLYLSEENTAVGCPAWPLSIEEQRTPEEPERTIPLALYNSNAPLYWVLNRQFLAIYPPNDAALKGLILHELGHVVDHKCDFTAKTALILGEDRLIAYPAREWMNEMYILGTKGRLGSIVLQYEFAKWLHGIMPPVPVQDHPFIDCIPLIPTMTPDKFREKVLQDFERELMYHPNMEPEEVLGDYYDDYDYLMND